MGDKWLKLVVNATSAVNAVIDSRDHDMPEFFALKARLLEEAAAVLAAEKIKPKSYDGKDRSISEMIAELRRPRARRTRHGVNIHNSTWQDLYLKRKRIESHEFHGPIIAMAKEHAIGVPGHQVLLEAVSSCHKSGVPPQSIRLEAILKAIEERTKQN
jgi:ketopantoate reductase